MIDIFPRMLCSSRETCVQDKFNSLPCFKVLDFYCSLDKDPNPCHSGLAPVALVSRPLCPMSGARSCPCWSVHKTMPCLLMPILFLAFRGHFSGSSWPDLVIYAHNDLPFPDGRLGFGPLVFLLQTVTLVGRAICFVPHLLQFLVQ